MKKAWILFVLALFQKGCFSAESSGVSVDGPSENPVTQDCDGSDGPRLMLLAM